MIDLRSDTVTRPTQAMREAMAMAEKIAEGRPEEIRRNAEVQAVYFGRGGRA